MNFPKFEQKIKDNITIPAEQQSSTSGYGIIIEYDDATNTAKVLMSARGSDQFGEVFKNVPCPVQIGIQHTAPEVGRHCWLDFKDSHQAFPIVTHYFNKAYEDIDYNSQTRAVNNVPRYLAQM